MMRISRRVAALALFLALSFLVAPSSGAAETVATLVGADAAPWLRADTDGGLTVFWSDASTTFARRYTADGEPFAENEIVHGFVSRPESGDRAVAATPEGGYVAAFEERGVDGRWRVLVHLYDADGEPLGAPHLLAPGGDADQRAPALAATDGGLFAAWLEIAQDGTSRIALSKVAATIFADAFENGDVSNWSSWVPGFTAAFSATPTLGAAPLDVAFNAGASFDPAATLTGYSWDFGDGSGTSSLAPVHTFTAPGTYTVVLTVTNSKGEQRVASTDITAVDNAAPTASFTATPTSGLDPLVVNVNADASSDSDGLVVEYRWDFGDGSTAVGVQASHIYDRAGTYQIVLTVVDNYGGEDVQFATIDVSPTITALDETSPLHREIEVALTRESVLRFNGPLDPTTVTASSVRAEVAGVPIGSTPHVSPDGRVVTLFYDAPLPASSRVRVIVDGDVLRSAGGALVDADRDGQAGGVGELDFDTLTLTTLNGTVVCGHVVAAEQGGGGVDTPLAGVLITVDGKEAELWDTTDGNGDFCLNPAPVGRFFVHIDGAAVSAPAGTYYPRVGKPWTSRVGQVVDVGTLYLPLIPAGTLQPVSQVAPTDIGFAASVLAANPEFAGTRITVPADSLYADNGTRGGSVGIAPVPPTRLPGLLPEGLELSLVITVQTDGATNFDVPAPICFPNLDDPYLGEPLPPGEKAELVSFNHDAGRWEAAGSMTVSEDGTLICSDPGQGVRAPGWHGAGVPPFKRRPCKGCCLGGALGTGTGIGCTADSCNSGLVHNPAMPNKIFQNCICGQSGSKGCKNFARCMEVALVGAPATIFGSCAIVAVLTAGTVAPICGATATAAFFVGGIGCFAKALDDILDPPNSVHPPAPKGGVVENPLTQEILDLTVELHRLLFPYINTPIESIPAEIVNQAYALIDQINNLSENPLGFLAQEGKRMEAELLQLSPELFEEMPFEMPSAPLSYAASFSMPNGTNLVIRGETGPFGRMDLFAPRDGKFDFFTLHEKDTNSAAANTLSQITRRIPNTRLGAYSLENDFDLDGLTEISELTFNTDPVNPDTDGDGILDGAEVAQGLDPLGGAIAQNGVIGTLSLPADALDVCAVNSYGAVALGDEGVAVLDLMTGRNPVRIAQIATPGTATAVACAGTLIAVTDSIGLHVIDAADPPAATIIHSVPIHGARAVTVAGDIAYVGAATGQVVTIDLRTGSLLEKLTLPEPIEDVALGGDHAYALGQAKLYALSEIGTPLALVGDATSTGNPPTASRRRLAIGDGIAYASHNVGYNTLDLSNPAAPVHLAKATSTQIDWKQIVPTGSGFGVGVVGVSPPLPNDQHNVSLYDLGNPLVTVPDFVTQYITPGRARAAAIWNALAYVADGDGGLQVVNYQSYDSLGIAPTINLDASFPLAPASVEEGQLVRVGAQVADDVQVRNVEFFLDGQRVLTDGNYPFEYRFRTPLLADLDGATSFTLRARAVDTGGNSTWTPEITIDLLTDVTAPQIVGRAPIDASVVGEVESLTVYFDELIDPASLVAGTFDLFDVGPDGIPGSGDDIAVGGGVISGRPQIQAVLLTVAGGLPTGEYRAVIQNVTDYAGNALAAPSAWTFEVLGDLDSDGDGIPDYIEMQLGLDPNDNDSDGDGTLDGDEDNDGDGVPNALEVRIGTDPGLPDSDFNGIGDGAEDPDADGLANAAEVTAGTDPLNPDTDFDGFTDGAEVAEGSNPLLGEAFFSFSLFNATPPAAASGLAVGPTFSVENVGTP